MLARPGLSRPPAPPQRMRRAFAFVALVLALSLVVATILAGVTRTPRGLTITDLPGVATPTPQRGHHARGRHSSPAATGEAKAKPGGKDAAPASAADEPRKVHTATKAAPAAAAPKAEPKAAPVPAAAPPKAAPRAAPVAAPKAAPKTTPAPSAPPELAPSPAPPAFAAARRFVRSYYAALDQHHFRVAWGMLSPDVQQAFGGFAPWRKGYARTVSHAVGGLTVSGTTVGLILRAGDRGACGKTVERRFAVTWHLARTAAGWRATAATARKLGGPEPC
jgi:hypothetical protein